MMRDSDGRPQTSRYLLIAGTVVALLSVVSWFTTGSGGHTSSESTKAGTCQIPSGATTGAEALPALISKLTAPLGSPNTRWTRSGGGTTLYSYCYNSIDGQQVIAAIGLMAGHGYTQASGSDPSTQTTFTKAQVVPYGVSLTSYGDLDLTRVDPQARGGLAIVWTDAQVTS
ncbi:MAG: hypothetical protein ABI429_05385 [Jatrophihabitantaceae bacterium]